MRFKLIRWTRQLRIWLGGRKEMEAKHYLFTLPKPMTPEQIWEKLWPHGWGYNVLSHAYKGQILTCRKLAEPHYQYHLRFYKNGDVSGHFEVDHGIFKLEHLDGVDLRPLKKEERDNLYQLLTS
ncbi:hypothetical protein LCGC14_1396230 [marine sediment metagenome]|uniref:Uncharacterized protein n=1 Tax=marine sediment metagenome TaxID=412755 RepID=A0A0F9JYK3_9ZZZZ